MDVLLGFIYMIEMKDGRYYVGRKQFWSKRGKEYIENDWRDYISSSTIIKSEPENIGAKKILAAFTSKSAMRYGEALGIIMSNSYLSPLGLNGSFESCRGTIKLEGEDKNQMEGLALKAQEACRGHG